MPENVRFDIDRIREFARECVEKMTLRDVAAAIGMSHSGLFSFLQGGTPYSRTRRQLAAWYVRASHESGPAIKPEELEAAITLIEEYIHSATSEEQAKYRARAIATRVLGSPKKRSS
jgi:hypothetical protein